MLDVQNSGRELEGHQNERARLHFGTMQPQIPVPTTAPEAPRRLPWDARSPIASRGPNAAPHPLFRGFEDRIDALKAKAGALEAALAEEDSVGAELWRRIKELGVRVSAGPGKRKVSMRMPPPGQTGASRASWLTLRRGGGGAAQEAPLEFPAADGARDARPRFKPHPW